MLKLDSVEVPNRVNYQLNEILRGRMDRDNGFVMVMLQREISKVKDAHIRIFLEGVWTAIYEDLDAGLTLCERAIQLNSTEVVTWENYVGAVHLLCGIKSSLDLRKRALEHIRSPKFMVETAAMLLAVNQFSKCNELLEQVIVLCGHEQGLNIIESFFENSYENISSLVSLPHSGEFEALNALMLEHIDDQYGKSVRAAIVHMSDCSDELGVSIYIENIGVDEIVDINASLIEARIDSGLTNPFVSGVYLQFSSEILGDEEPVAFYSKGIGYVS